NVGTDRSGGNGVANGFHDRQAMRLSDLLSKLAAAPIATMLQLRDFTTGISYLLGQVDLLAERLRTHNSFHPRQRTLAIQICGKNPRDLFTDRVVKDWNIAYLSGIHGKGSPLTGEEAAQIFVRDVPDA